MATTGIWKIQKRLDHVIDYIVNIEKTEKSNNYKSMHNFSEYDDLDYNTEESCYVSGINCLTDTAYKDMMFTKEQYRKKDGILGYHAFQSFKKGEVTPELAHQIGLKLAQELWGDYEVVVATHINTKHIHNHFVINSVSFKNGKKYHDSHESYAILRNTSDSLCEEYGLSVVDRDKCKKGKVDYSKYYKGYVKKSNYHTIAKQDLDKAIGMAYSYSDFINILNKMGYEVMNRYGKLSIKREPYKKNIRISRSFGSEYEIERIEERIKEEQITRVPFIEVYNPKNRVKIFEQHKKQKAHGIYGLYRYYCFLIKDYSNYYPEKVLTPALRVESQKLDEISKQTNMLAKNKIETYEQLLFYKNELSNKVEDLLSKKHNFWIKHKRVKSDYEKNIIRNNIESISNELSKYKEEVLLCDGVIKRLDIVNENVKEFEEKGKEKIKGEFK